MFREAGVEVQVDVATRNEAEVEVPAEADARTTMMNKPRIMVGWYGEAGAADSIGYIRVGLKCYRKVSASISKTK